MAADYTALFYYSLSYSTTCNNSNVQLSRCYYFRKLCIEARPLTYQARLMARPRRDFFLLLFGDCSLVGKVGWRKEGRGNYFFSTGKICAPDISRAEVKCWSWWLCIYQEAQPIIKWVQNSIIRRQPSF